MLLKEIAIVAVLASCFCVWKADASQTESFDVKTVITARFAETTISSQVRNDKTRSQEINFQVLLPKEAFISGFSMIIDGKTYDAIVEEKVKAEKAFQAAKELNKTAGLVSTRKESTKTFKTSVNIEAGEMVEFRLVYQQLIRRIRGKYKHQIILLGSQLTDLLKIEVYICEKQPIKTINVPPILSSDGKNVTVKTVVDKQRNSAHVEYLQGDNHEATKALASSGGSFVVEYELEPTPDAGQIVLNNGFFAYFYAPAIKIEPRRVVFALDTSGSMSGYKISQLKEAMINIVDKLTEEDRFSIVTFSSGVTTWKGTNRLQSGSRTNIEDSKSFIRNLIAGGGTDIHGALKKSLEMLNIDVGNVTVDRLSNYIVFVTDGQPTSGVITDPSGILQNVDSANTRNFSIHAIGIGSGVDAGFLKSLAAKNNGTWTQILADLNAALQIQNYLDELSVSLLKDIVIDYPEDIVDEFIVHNKDSFLAGGELMALGRFKENIDPRNRGPHVIQITGNAEGDVVLQAQFFLDEKPPGCRAVPSNVVKDFGMKSFALTDVVETLRQYDAETDDILKEEIKELAINKSITAGLVTPVTSMLVIKPEDKKDIENKIAEGENKHAKQDISTTPAPRPAATRSPVATTVPWWQVQGDPHFIIHLSDSITTCFNWLGESGEVFNLLHDPKHDIVINGMVDGPDSVSKKTYAIFITKLVILLKKEHLAITINARETIVRDNSSGNKRKRDLKLPMVNVASYQAVYGHVIFRISNVTVAHTILNVTVAENISFIVNLHHTSATHQSKDVAHLDLMISGTEMLSPDVGGVFGRFPRKQLTGEENVASIETSGSKTYLWYRDQVTPVTKTSMMVPYLHKKVECWFVAKPSAILGAALDSFKLNSLASRPRKQIHER
uniref:inter-alpha-trypsin inhibitor heavy chain H2-like n=1 Tax=Styela clava TaxID=7725 RepID=UPI001939A3B2|nr:inter-alpha-trypsin inhibitor heavy chain H2-like [Styela clava]XP_039268361.1 inter-alpha-trypsin inhibitor heavy chain H2-like [Styela clava]